MRFLVTVIAPSLALVLSGCGGLGEAERHYNAGVELGNEKQFEEAISEYGETIRLDPEHSDAYNKRGALYNVMGLRLLAIEDFDEAIRLNAEHGDAYYNRGNAYAMMAQPERAIGDLNEAIRLDPENELAYIARQQANLHLSEHERFSDRVEEAVRLDPKNPLANCSRGAFYAHAGQYQQAIDNYDEAIRLDSRLAVAYFYCALAHALLNMDANAQKDADIAVELGMDHTTLDKEIGRIKGGRLPGITMEVCQSRTAAR